jgi:hypothetical protein
MMRRSFHFCQYRVEYNYFSAVLADFGAAARTCSFWPRAGTDILRTHPTTGTFRRRRRTTRQSSPSGHLKILEKSINRPPLLTAMKATRARAEMTRGPARAGINRLPR